MLHTTTVGNSCMLLRVYRFSFRFPKWSYYPLLKRWTVPTGKYRCVSLRYSLYSHLYLYRGIRIPWTMSRRDIRARIYHRSISAAHTDVKCHPSPYRTRPRRNCVDPCSDFCYVDSFLVFSSNSRITLFLEQFWPPRTSTKIKSSQSWDTRELWGIQKPVCPNSAALTWIPFIYSGAGLQSFVDVVDRMVAQQAAGKVLHQKLDKTGPKCFQRKTLISNTRYAGVRAKL